MYTSQKLYSFSEIVFNYLQCIPVLNRQISKILQWSPEVLTFEILNRPIADKNCEEIMKQVYRSIKKLHMYISKRQAVKYLSRYTARNESIGKKSWNTDKYCFSYFLDVHTKRNTLKLSELAKITKSNLNKTFHFKN